VAKGNSLQLESSADFESDLTIVEVARQFVRRTLRSWRIEGEVEADAVLLASELITNAVLHARTGIRVVLHTDGAALRVSVFDENPRLPTYEACSPEATSGRGLSLVQGMAGAWGVQRSDGGKVVWFEMAGRGAAGDAYLDLTDAGR
jgi:anti-sigma regulatory factor (Ser/Thr protein kinase)